MCADLGVKVEINPVRPGYLLTYTRENIVYGPYAAVNLKDCLAVALKLLDQSHDTPGLHPLVEETVAASIMTRRNP
jgi:hypothetical protein